MSEPARVPARAWVVTAAGTAVNLCLGILYAWSVWKAGLIGTRGRPPGTAMSGLNDGWHYLTDSVGGVGLGVGVVLVVAAIADHLPSARGRLAARARVL